VAAETEGGTVERAVKFKVEMDKEVEGDRRETGGRHELRDREGNDFLLG
jgi:hypothetical protein